MRIVIGGRDEVARRLGETLAHKHEVVFVVGPSPDPVMGKPRKFCCWRCALNPAFTWGMLSLRVMRAAARACSTRAAAACRS